MKIKIKTTLLLSGKDLQNLKGLMEQVRPPEHLIDFHKELKDKLLLLTSGTVQL